MADEASATADDIDLKLFTTAVAAVGNGNANKESPMDEDSQSQRIVVGRGPSSLTDDDEKLNFGDSGNEGNISGSHQDDDSNSEEPSFNLRLIDAVRQNRCLYDSLDRQYRSADHKIKVWNRLVQVLGFHGDARTLYNRWKQLRDKYGKEKRKMKCNGDLSQWQFFKHLEFLDPHMVDRTQLKFERTKDGKLIYKESNRPVVISDPNFALHLIHEVRLQPCLFDIKDTKYRHTDYRNQAWADIIKNLNFPGDINAIYKQWKKIRDRYVREKRKMRMSANGESEEPTWDLFRELMWIDPYLEERAAQVKRKRESSEMSDDAYLDDFNLSGRASEQPPQYTMVMQQPPLNSTPNHIQHLQMSSTSKSAVGRQILATAAAAPPPSAGSATTAILAHGTTLMMQPVLAPAPNLTATQLIQGTASHPQQHVIITNELLDGDRAFALSVAADLSALPEVARNMARAQIQHLLENSKITIVKA